MSRRRPPYPTGLLAALLSLGAGCDALLGLGEPPSDELSGAGGSTVSSSSSTSGGGEGGASTVTSTSSGGVTSSVSTAGGSTGDGGGGGGAGGPTDLGCGPCNADGCVTTCDDAAACLLRVTDVTGTSRGGRNPGEDALRERLGRDIVVTDDVVAFARHRTDGTSGLTLVPRGGGPAIDAAGDLASAVAGVALSGDGARIAVTPHAGPPLQIVDLDGSPSVEDVSAAALGLPDGTLFGAVAPLGQSRFVAAHRDSGDLYHIDLQPAPSACLVAGRDVFATPVDVEVLPAGGRVRVLRYFASGEDIDDHEGELTCPAAAPAPVDLMGFDKHHALVTRGEVTYVLGMRGGSAYVSFGTDTEVQAFAGFGLDVTGDGVLVPVRNGGLGRCDHDLEGCQQVAPPAAVGHVQHVRDVGDVIYTVGMSGDTSEDVAKVACIVDR